MTNEEADDLWILDHEAELRHELAKLDEAKKLPLPGTLLARALVLFTTKPTKKKRKNRE